MRLEASHHGDVLIVAVREPRVDAAVAVQFKDALRGLASDAPARVVLDLRDVAFLDSSGLGAVVAVMKHLAPARRLELAALSPMVEKVFRLTRMDTVFRIHPDAAAALNTAADAP